MRASRSKMAKPSIPLPDFVNALTQLHDQFAPSLKTLPKNGQHAETLAEYDKARAAFPEGH